MRTTPQILAEIRSYRHRYYTNIFQIVPDETRLFGTESLYGDWDAALLLLAKDFAPVQVVRRRISEGDSRPFRHGQSALDFQRMGVGTNEHIETLTARLQCKKLYGSAFGGLLRNDGKASGPLPGYAHVRDEYAAGMLKWVIEEATNLRMVVCLGWEAWDCLFRSARTPTSLVEFKAERGSGRPLALQLDGRTINVFAMCHPAARVSNSQKFSGWERFIEGAASISGQSVREARASARIPMGVSTDSTNIEQRHFMKSPSNRFAYWSSFCERIATELPNRSRPTPPERANGVDIRVGISDVHLFAWVNSQQGFLRCGVAFRGGRAQQRLDHLKPFRGEIERLFGGALEFYEPDDKPERQVRQIVHGFDIENKQDWPRQHGIALGILKRLDAHVLSRVR